MDGCTNPLNLKYLNAIYLYLLYSIAGFWGGVQTRITFLVNTLKPCWKKLFCFNNKS